MTWLGQAWLLYLDWQTARSPTEPVEAAAAPLPMRGVTPFTPCCSC
jgi:threonine/homoserine/homoserine lactone efflux protein